MLNIQLPTNIEKIENKIINSEALWKKGIKNGSMKAGRSIQKRVTTLLSSGSRSGRKYRGLPNRSSAPGENPRTQSGRLARSVYYNSGVNQFSVGATEDHATYLTEGTKRMEARPHKNLPFFELAIEQEEKNTEEYLTKGVKDEIC